ncbi:MAG TPA: glycosyltransferase family 4 protein [Pirellulaceae bacterium]|jgi:glycosyltransferase involved in cell wall biosynthesis
MTALISQSAGILTAPRRTTDRIKRVCLVTEAAGGGVGRHFLDLAAGLAQRNIEVVAIYSPGRCDASFQQSQRNVGGVQFVELPMRRAIHPLDAADLLKLTRCIRRHGPFDLIHCHSSKGGALGRVAAALLRTPSIYTPHALVTLDPTLSPLKRRMYGTIERWLSRPSAAIIAVSPDEAEHAAQLGIAPQKIHVVLNGIDPPNFTTRESARQQLGLRPDDFCIGFVGRLTAQKAPELLIAALAELKQKHPSAVAVFVGSGPLENQLRKQIDQLGLAQNVRLLGDTVATNIMPAFDVFCLPSRYEGLPYVLLEALAAGLPIVARRVGGVAACIDHDRNGLIVENESSSDLAAALHRLASDVSLRGEFATRSAIKAAALSVNRMIDDTLSVYESVVTHPAGRR